MGNMSSFSVRNYAQAERRLFWNWKHLNVLHSFWKSKNKTFFLSYWEAGQNMPHRYAKCDHLQPINNAELWTIPMSHWGLQSEVSDPRRYVLPYRDCETCPLPQLLLSDIREIIQISYWYLKAVLGIQVKVGFLWPLYKYLELHLCWKELKLQELFRYINNAAMNRNHRWLKMHIPISFPTFPLFLLLPHISPVTRDINMDSLLKKKKKDLSYRT